MTLYKARAFTRSGFVLCNQAQKRGNKTMVTTELRTACCNSYYTDWDGILVCRKCEARNPEIIEVDSDSMCNESGMVIEFGRPGVGKTNIEHDSKDEVMLIYVLDDGETWTLTDADGGCVSSSLLGVALDVSSSKGMLLRGFAQVSQSGQLELGQKVYMYDDGIVTGSVTDYASGDFVRVLGHCVDSGNTNGSASIYFNPDNTYIEVS